MPSYLTAKINPENFDQMGKHLNLRACRFLAIASIIFCFSENYLYHKSGIFFGAENLFLSLKWVMFFFNDLALLFSFRFLAGFLAIDGLIRGLDAGLLE
jgi:hypothetical protein